MRTASLILSCLLLGAAPSWADVHSGLENFQQGRFSEAVRDWRQAADAGDPVASLYLGVVYDTGFGVPQDQRRALDWYRRGAEAGNATASFNTAIMFDAGRGTARAPAAAIDWYERAAREGLGRAAYNLGLIYEYGIDVAPDRGRAIRFYQDAVRAGVSEARSHLERLGVRTAGVTGVPKIDPAMANFQRAQHLLLARGTGDMGRAVELFRKAAEAGNPLAAYNLAYCYEHGLGLPASTSQAVLWYRRSAADASDEALREMAQLGERNLLANTNQAQR